MLHRHGASDKITLLDELCQQQLLMQRIGHRAIGVTYNSGAETRNALQQACQEATKVDDKKLRGDKVIIAVSPTREVAIVFNTN